MTSFRDQMKIKRLGVKHKFSRELYFFILKASWTYFVGGFVLIFILINALFAALYMLDPQGISHISENSFFENFVFSSQTFSTVGYGYYLPITTYTHFISVVENMAGLLFTAIMTGLTFAKFSRPTSSVIFSDKAIVVNYEGVPTLMFRLGNGRDTSIVDANISLVTLRSEKTSEGHFMQRFVDLKLERAHSPFFLLTWTVMHRLDEQSPFHGFMEEDFRKNKTNLYVSLKGYDETLAETVHSAWLYPSDKIHFGRKFIDVVEMEGDGTRILDFSKFHEFLK
ncbi:MAG: ion channel [Pseudobdellovibrionaceae bacterium]